MHRSIVLIGLAALAAGIWLLLEGIAWPARAFAVFLLVPLPALAVAQMRAMSRIDPAQLPRLPVYGSSAAMLWLLTIVALTAASSSRFTARLLGLVPLSAQHFWAWTIFGVASAIMLYAFARYWRVQESPLLVHLLPRSWFDRLAFLGLSITAGVCEEIVFRGFLISTLTVPLGSSVLAALVSSAAFGLLHAYQHVSGALRASILGLALAVPFLVTGSLLPSIAAHSLIDVIGGLWLSHEHTRARGLH